MVRTLKMTSEFNLHSVDSLKELIYTQLNLTASGRAFLVALHDQLARRSPTRAHNIPKH